MRILSFLNVSNSSNLEADSGFIFQNILLKELHNRGHEVFLIGPKEMNSLLNNGISAVNIKFADTKYGVRLGLCWEELKNALKEIESCDILLVNQSELTIPLQLLCYEMWLKKITTITYFHYLAIKKIQKGNVQIDDSQNALGVGQIFWRRQIESAIHSDANIIGSHFGKKLFISASGKLDLERKFFVIPPPSETPFELRADNSKNESLNLMYNHRLYEHYGTSEVFELLEKVNKEVSFKVIVTDPTFNRSVSRDSLDKSIVNVKSILYKMPFVEVNHSMGHREYLKGISQIDIGIGHLREGALWSMSIADMMSNGVPVIGFDKGGIKEIINDKDLLCKSNDEFVAKLKRLLLDQNYRTSKALAAKMVSQQFCTKVIVDKFEAIFNKCYNEHFRN